MNSERRQHQRIRIDGAANIKLADGRPYAFAPLMDFSPSGCYIETMYPLPIGTELQLDITIKALDAAITVDATVRTSDMGVGMGVKFGENYAPRLLELLQQLEGKPTA
ncbi:MAG TPA: PilZ domain-containing protein [Terriglobales bacterium]|nr:PilZ domain-containing protein [Terriglobales bacterium]